MTNIRLADLFGQICVDPDDGALACTLADDALARGEIVCLDFTGVSTLATAFLNAAVGCLFARYAEEDLLKRLTWLGLDATDEALLDVIKRNAVRFYSASQEERDILSAASSRVPDDQP